MEKGYYIFIEIRCPKCNKLEKIGFGTYKFISCEGIICGCGNKLIEKVYKKEIK